MTFSNSYKTGGFVSLWAPRWAVPGTYLLWRSQYGFGPVFRVVDVTQDQNFTYVRTNLPGSFPTYVEGASDACAPCSQVYLQQLAVTLNSLSQAPAAIPLYSHSKRTYTASASGVTGASPVTVWGKLSMVNLNVTTPSTSALKFQLSQFNNWPLLQLSGSLSYLASQVNMQIAGERTINPTSVSGGAIGDILSLPGAGALFLGPSHSGPTFTAAASGSPSVTVEILSDE